MQFDIISPAPPGDSPRSLLALARRYERWAIGALLLLIVAISLWLISAPGNFPRNSLITIPHGASAHDFAEELQAAHVIRSAFLFRAFAHLSGFDHHLDTGAYAFTDPETLPGVLWRLGHGRHGIAPVRVTLTEGMTRFDIAEEDQR